MLALQTAGSRATHLLKVLGRQPKKLARIAVAVTQQQHIVPVRELSALAADRLEPNRPGEIFSICPDLPTAGEVFPIQVSKKTDFGLKYDEVLVAACRTH